ncbi:MAG: 4Fe-4S binding protein [Candidatus Auribacterota bacterium]|nr:4Fe-4S binding protein [Candidatus Auribacterota bacterium]
MQIARRIVQVVTAIAVNCSFLLGQPLPNKIYQGPWKQFCSPGLNCYACPYAVGACPIGSLQHFLGYGAYHFSVYISGFLLLFGVGFGRLICGWICPFGLFQDLLHKIPTRKFKFFQPLGYFRWVALIGLVLLLPLLTGEQSYCRYICPAGSLEGGVPYGIFSAQIRTLIGTMYFIKLGILLIFIAGSIFTFRFFCRTACPLGLIYGFFNRIAILGLSFDPDRCTDCGLCEEACPVDLKPQKGEYLSTSCIRCMKCRDACPQNCFKFGPVKFKGNSGKA